MQDLICSCPGVLFTRVGYTGGDTPNATYRSHGSHAEAIEITYDPSATTYRELLEFFFQIHDPAPRTGRAMTWGRPTGRPSSTSTKNSAGSPRTRSPMSTHAGYGRARSSPGSRQLGRSGRLSPNTRTTCCAAPRLHLPLPAAGLGAPAA